MIPVGSLWCRQRGQRQSASFEFTRQWQGNKEFHSLRPAFPISFHTKPGEDMFAVFGDSAPDRWGRDLMRHAETKRARGAGETPRALVEADYLLGVNDEARQGALRFSLAEAGPYLTRAAQSNIPPLVNLAAILAATEKYLADREDVDDLKTILMPGSSLGGARPKAAVRDKDGQLAIAKFAKEDDKVNAVVWEAVALYLAKKAGLDVAEARVEKLPKLGNKAVLIVRRFDRRVGGGRIPFLSAMGMLNASDHDDQHSYLDMAYSLIQHGSRPNADLAQLWRRIVFNALISNRDDHLRNHAFLYDPYKGWRLSPVYDVNPSPFMLKGRMLESAGLDIALSVCEEFRLKLAEAKSISREVATATKTWRTVAKQLGATGRDMDDMAGAFEHDDLKAALK